MNREQTTEIYRRLRPMMEQKAAQMLHDAEDSRDVVADLFVRLTEGTLAVPDIGAEAYLMGCVRHACLDRLKHLSVRERVKRRLSLSQPSTTEENGREEMLHDLLSYAEKNFTPQTWRVFQLRFDEHLKYKEIAERLHISEVAVYKHLAQALTKLKTHFNS
mgnify:CR=1 FL=1